MSRAVMPECVTKDLINVSDTGDILCSEFVQERMKTENGINV